MNRIDPTKARKLFYAFAQGVGVRAAAKAAGVNRGTAASYRRQWLAVRPALQRAYDAMWDGDCETCDAMNADLPEAAVLSMLDCWLEDWSDDPHKSGWHAGYEDPPQTQEAPASEHEG